MYISPKKIYGELESAYRLRMLAFCFACLLLFGALLGLMLVVRPEAANSEFPLLIMFLWFGMSLAFGASVLATFGYLIGYLFSLLLEHFKSAGLLWPKVKLILVAIILVPLIPFSLYWFLFGIYNMEVLPFARYSHYKLISSNDNPLIFWFSVLMWGSCGTWLPYLTLRGILKNLTLRSSGTLMFPQIS